VIGMFFVATIGLSPVAEATDTARLTQLRMVVDSATWADVKASQLLPEAFGAGFLAGPAEVRLCDRLSCLVFVPEDSAAGEIIGDLVVGVRPVSGSALATRLLSLTSTRTRVVIVEEHKPVTTASGPLPIMYFIKNATIAVEEEAIEQLGNLLRSSGASVFPEGEGLVVHFANQIVRFVPGWGGSGPEQLEFYLRREHPGNPTYKFGSRGRLRFGPGRNASWVF
jgi:hypothetical protein